MPERSQNRISAINSPHQLALGVAFGVVIGIMPKDSAIPWLIGLAFLLSRGNLLCGIVAAIGMSIVSPSLDLFSNRMGESVLKIGFLQSTFVSWMDIPWIAWTRFNNTVVAGSFAIGLLSSLPVYLLSQVFFRVWGIAMIERVMGTRVVQFLFGEAEQQENLHDTHDSSLITET